MQIGSNEKPGGVGVRTCFVSRLYKKMRRMEITCGRQRRNRQSPCGPGGATATQVQNQAMPRMRPVVHWSPRRWTAIAKSSPNTANPIFTILAYPSVLCLRSWRVISSVDSAYGSASQLRSWQMIRLQTRVGEAQSLKQTCQPYEICLECADLAGLFLCCTKAGSKDEPA
eukprot:scaffold39657_cov23-Tisochrysis_lutea.AAC.1